MNSASARRRPGGARVVPRDPNATALVIEREVTDDVDGQPWPPTGLGDGWHLVPGLQANTLETHPTRTRADVTGRA